MHRNKVQPVPAPVMPREIKINNSGGRKIVKWFVLVFLLVGLGIGLWVGYTANNALKKITDDSGSNSSLFSFLGDFSSNNLKGKAQGRTNILLLGMGGKNHPGGMLSDTIIVFSINYSENKIGLISVPRDLWVPIPGFGSAKINEAYADGEKNKKTTGGGGALVSRTVENVFGIPIHYWVSADFEGFKKAVDTLGGIDIYVEKSISDPYYPAPNMINYEPFRIDVGQHHMDGALALKYARSRETTSDFDRSRRQQQVMTAMKDKVFSLGFVSNPKRITDMLNILGDHVRTNMQSGEMRTFLEVMKTLDTENITSKVLDTTPGGPLVDTSDTRGYYIYPRKGITNFTDLQIIAKNLFIENDLTLAPARIEILNASGVKGQATSVSETLEASGYTIIRVGNATKYSSATYIYDCTGGQFLNAAKTIASQLGGQHQSKSSCGSTGIDIQVVIGQDYQNR